MTRHLHPAPPSGRRAQLRDMVDDVTVTVDASDLLRLLDGDDDPDLRRRLRLALDGAIFRAAERRAR